MAETDWTELADGQAPADIVKGVTAGIDPPNGGGTTVYGFNSLNLVTGAVGMFANTSGFAPTAQGGSVRGAVMRSPNGGGKTNFAPFLFLGCQGSSVNDSGYMLGLSDAAPYHIVLKKGVLTSGLADVAPVPATNGTLLRSSATYTAGTWHHLRLDMIVQGTGDVVLQVFENDLTTNTVASPVWVQVAGMEGTLSSGVTGFVDDALSINTGTAPFTAGRIGYGFHTTDVSRRSFFDQLEVSRQI